MEYAFQDLVEVYGLIWESTSFMRQGFLEAVLYTVNVWGSSPIRREWAIMKTIHIQMKDSS